MFFLVGVPDGTGIPGTERSTPRRSNRRLHTAFVPRNDPESGETVRQVWKQRRNTTGDENGRDTSLGPTVDTFLPVRNRHRQNVPKLTSVSFPDAAACGDTTRRIELYL